jgi:hypothetical protein
MSICLPLNIHFSKPSPDERSDIRRSSLLNPMTLIEIEGVAALKG